MMIQLKHHRNYGMVEVRSTGNYGWYYISMPQSQLISISLNGCCVSNRCIIHGTVFVRSFMPPWVLHKMVAIVQMPFKCYFCSCISVFVFLARSHWSLFHIMQLRMCNHWFMNGRVTPKNWQAIAWTNKMLLSHYGLMILNAQRSWPFIDNFRQHTLILHFMISGQLYLIGLYGTHIDSLMNPHGYKIWSQNSKAIFILMEYTVFTNRCYSHRNSFTANTACKTQSEC